MRCNQVSIFIERFGEYVPKDYPNNIQRVSVYADDSTSIYAALAKANALAINTLNEYEHIGVKSYVSTNEYSTADYKEMHGYTPIEYNDYEDDIELQCTYKPGELLKDRIFVHENLEEIIKLISSTDNKKVLKALLKERYGLSDFQIKKLLSMRLDMLSKADYLSDIEEKEEYENDKDNPGWSPVRMIQYSQYKICGLSKKIEEYKAYISIAENYKELIEIINNNPNLSDYAPIIEEKYGFCKSQVSLIKLVTVDDIVSVQRYKEEIDKLEDEITRYKSDIEDYMEMQRKSAADIVDND